MMILYISGQRREIQLHEEPTGSSSGAPARTSKSASSTPAISSVSPLVKTIWLRKMSFLVHFNILMQRFHAYLLLLLAQQVCPRWTQLPEAHSPNHQMRHTLATNAKQVWFGGIEAERTSFAFKCTWSVKQIEASHRTHIEQGRLGDDFCYRSCDPSKCPRNYSSSATLTKLRDKLVPINRILLFTWTEGISEEATS